ncbi:DoxX family protein [Marinomonas balearica]|uniref:Putative oxidoreductase n=1 Tax=Marinomonas balearica TaxID=491947 RepID=A0A4R6M7A1_9GAMM|nr:DoxX family protein [Marinomonas balearica]TDO97271.1 putative oxidoreductase [Marinomonas balearica]
MLDKLNSQSIALFEKIPESIVLFVARFSLAAVFWKSGQTKVEGFALDFISFNFQFGLPKLAESTVFLFEYEYGLPLIPPMIAAVLATIAEHVLPIFILFGFLTRFAALGLAGMTLVIQTFVYPDAYPTHGTWLTICLFLMLRGAGKFSADYFAFKKQ